MPLAIINSITSGRIDRTGSGAEGSGILDIQQKALI